jgi:hypothetical protein
MQDSLAKQIHACYAIEDTGGSSCNVPAKRPEMGARTNGIEHMLYPARATANLRSSAVAAFGRGRNKPCARAKSRFQKTHDIGNTTTKGLIAFYLV